MKDLTGTLAGDEVKQQGQDGKNTQGGKNKTY
jgi:hypothetical protein